jgi:hypothetical protein
MVYKINLFIFVSKINYLTLWKNNFQVLNRFGS